jgi:hypothetical protein
LLIEAMADGGVRAGLPRQEALRLAAQTVAGAAAMVLETGEHPAVLRDRVTSPGGTTIAGLVELERQGVRHGVIQAVDAAAQIEVALADGRRVPAAVVGSDPDTDLAVIKVELTGLPAITLGDTSRLRVGDVVTFFEVDARRALTLRDIKESAACWVLTLRCDNVQYHMRPWQKTGLEIVPWIANVKRGGRVLYARESNA